MTTNLGLPCTSDVLAKLLRYTHVFTSLVSTTLYRLRRGEGSGKTPLPGFVLIARASDKINEVHGVSPHHSQFWLTTNTCMFSHPSN